MTAPVSPADRYLRRLRARRRATADGRLVTFRGRLAVLRDVVLDPARCIPDGGPDGLARFQPGFLHLDGLRLPRLRWRRPRLRRPPLQAVLATLGGAGPTAAPAREPRPHVLVVRAAPATLFGAMTDWYNVFVVQRFLGVQAVRVVLADGRPAAPLDAAWPGLFGDVVRVGALGPDARRLETLAVAPLGFDSPLLAWRARQLPLAAAFRRFVLEAHGVAVDDGPRRPGPLRVTLVRREHEAASEAVLLQVLRTLADVEARAVALEGLPFREQVALAAATDVLVGAHGPGLTHALLLPPWAGVVELFPGEDTPRARHYRRLAEWRGLFYTAWQPRERGPRPAAIPPAVVVDALRRYAYRPGRRL